MSSSRVLAGICAVLAMIPAAYAQQAQYRLGVQDRLKIHVHEWPVLTGEFTVGAGGALMLPLIGEVKAAGGTTTEVANAIAEKLLARAKLTRAPETVVDISQYRPFYIVGGVDKPGEYAYRPELVVLKAVSIAGGFYRSLREADWGAERDAIVARGEVRVSMEKVNELQVRELRLRAEAADAAEFAPSAADAPEGIRKLLDEEKLVFKARRDRHLAQLKSLEDSIVLGEKEIQSLIAQIGTTQQQHDVASKEFNEVRQRVRTGVSNASLISPIERTVAQLEREKQSLEATVLRTRQQITVFRRDLNDAVALRKNTALADLQTLKTQLAEAEEKMATAARIAQGATGETSIRGDTSNPDVLQVRYFIVREVNGVSEEVEVTETTPVMPGNIVKVLRTQPTRGTIRNLGARVNAGSAVQN